jgi:hypothetical protein
MEQTMQGESLRDSLFEAKEHSASYRIKAFVERLHFDSTVHDHYCGRNSDLFSASRQCYFCKSYQRSGFGLMLQVPADYDRFIIGGSVLVCALDARRALLKPGIGGVAVFSKALALAHENKIHKEVCVHCKKLYPITLAEYSYRRGQETEGKHLCPDCAYEQMYSMEPDPIVLPMQQGVEFLDRNIFVACQFCDEPITLDTTLPKKFLHKQFVSNMKRICKVCRTYGDQPLFSFVSKDKRFRAYPVKDDHFRVVVTARNSDRFLLDYIYHGPAFELYFDLSRNVNEEPRTV